MKSTKTWDVTTEDKPVQHKYLLDQVSNSTSQGKTKLFFTHLPRQSAHQPFVHIHCSFVVFLPTLKASSLQTRNTQSLFLSMTFLVFIRIGMGIK